ncbi:MAG: pirin family protein [Bacteroidetes bacterium]|nr:pirin family protein [Bacteroidota bacterium]
MANNILSIRPLGFPWETQDPFLFCVHHLDHYPPGNDKMGPDPKHFVGRNIGNDFVTKNGWRMYHGSEVPGFPYHPHRGFETITIGLRGFVDHTDSLGAAGRFGNGDVQWMTAGRGLQHSEMFPLINREDNNTLEIFQIWLNLPRKNKMVDPHFKMLWANEIPIVNVTDDAGNSTQLRIIAGNYNGAKAPSPAPNSWAAENENDVAVWTVKLEPNAQFTIPKASTNKVNRSLYFYSGDSLTIDNKAIDKQAVIDLNSQADISLKNGNEASFLLMLQGKPIEEPVAQHGPFVMNTRQEIQDAFMEYQRTEFGGWPWPAREFTHPRDKGRFALYADGTEETPNLQ